MSDSSKECVFRKPSKPPDFHKDSEKRKKFLTFKTLKNFIKPLTLEISSFITDIHEISVSKTLKSLECRLRWTCNRLRSQTYLRKTSQNPHNAENWMKNRTMRKIEWKSAHHLHISREMCRWCAVNWLKIRIMRKNVWKSTLCGKVFKFPHFQVKSFLLVFDNFPPFSTSTEVARLGIPL